MPQGLQCQVTADAPADRATEPFPGFEHFTANFLYCPNQFFDVCLPNSSRGVVRLVAHLLRRTLGWLDENGNPIEQNVAVSYRELIESAGISRGAIRPVIDQALAGGFIRCVERGRSNAPGAAAKSARYALRWDEEGEYLKHFQGFRGFYAGDGHRTPIPNAFFDRVVPREPLAVVKVVGTVLRHTVGYQNQFGGRRSDAPLSYDYIQGYANVGDRTTLSEAIRHATASGYVRLVSPGVFDPSAKKRRPATYAVKWLAEAESAPISSETRPADAERFTNPTSDGSEIRPAERFKNPTIEKTMQNNTSKQQHAAAEREDDKTYLLLRSVGFDASIAGELARRRGLAQVEQQLTWLPKRNPSRNRLGLLRRAIEENWGPPAVAENTLRREVQWDRDRADSIRTADADAKRSAHHQRLLSVWQALSAAEQAAVTDRAVAGTRSAFIRARIQRSRGRGSLDNLPLDVLLFVEPYMPGVEAAVAATK